jgi:hypothetical protein
MRLVVVLVGLAIGFAVSTVAQQKDTVDPNIEQQIRALVSKYDKASNILTGYARPIPNPRAASGARVPSAA